MHLLHTLAEVHVGQMVPGVATLAVHHLDARQPQRAQVPFSASQQRLARGAIAALVPEHAQHALRLGIVVPIALGLRLGILNGGVHIAHHPAVLRRDQHQIVVQLARLSQGRLAGSASASAAIGQQKGTPSKARL